MAMTRAQLDADNYDANVREIAPSYDADVFYSIATHADYIQCGKCGRKFRGYLAELKREHATPIRNKHYLDIPCEYATWSGAMATHAIFA